MRIWTPAAFVVLLILFISGTANKAFAQQKGFISNPIIKGYYADPSIIKEGDTYYIYATIDPWGGEE